jgi:hypothetical protein
MLVHSVNSQAKERQPGLFLALLPEVDNSNATTAKTILDDGAVHVLFQL